MGGGGGEEIHCTLEAGGTAFLTQQGPRTQRWQLQGDGTLAPFTGCWVVQHKLPGSTGAALLLVTRGPTQRTQTKTLCCSSLLVRFPETSTSCIPEAEDEAQRTWFPLTCEKEGGLLVQYKLSSTLHSEAERPRKDTIIAIELLLPTRLHFG